MCVFHSRSLNCHAQRRGLDARGGSPQKGPPIKAFAATAREKFE